MSKYPVEEMIALYPKYNGNHKLIADELGCSRELVRQKLSPLGYKATAATNPDLVEKREVLANAIEGLPRNQAMKLLGTTPSKLKTLEKRTKVKLVHSATKYTKEVLIAAYEKNNGHYSKMAEELETFQGNISRTMKKLKLNKQYPSKGRNKK